MSSGNRLPDGSRLQAVAARTPRRRYHLPMLGDLHESRWLYLKAALLVGVGLLASVILILDNPHWRTAALLAIAVWGFARAYYFAFYVVEKYADPSFRFSGLGAFGKYLVSNRLRKSSSSERSI